MARIRELTQLDLEALLDEADESDSDVDVLTEIGARYIKERNFACAEEWLGRALAVNPRDPCANLFLGNLRQFQGKHRESIPFFAVAAEVLADVALPYWLLASSIEQLGDHERAGAFYKMAVKVDPKDPEAKRRLEEWYERHYTPKCSDRRHW